MHRVKSRDEKLKGRGDLIKNKRQNMKLLENNKEGWNIPLGFGRKSGKKAHYFRNNVSLCKRYKIEGEFVTLPDGSYYSHECCSECLKLKNKDIC